MHVCLVIPPSPYLLSDRSLPWLGPLWVAACLRDQGHQVRVLDLAGDIHYLSTVMADIGADCYGLTATAPDYPLAVEIRDALKLAHPSARMILGGAYATVASSDCHGWDAVVAGDGFYATNRALTENGIISASKKGEIVEDLDPLPFAARDLVDLESYEFRILGERFTSSLTSLGCPMGCTFCCGRDTYVYRKLRAFSPARVLREWDDIRYHYPSFRGMMDYSDEWNIPANRAIALAEAIAAHPTKWMIRCFIKSELFTDDVAKAMAKAGVVEVLTGVESGSDRILKLIKKNTTWAINGQARLTAKKYGIRFKAATMVGLPTETREDALLTKQWLMEFKPDEFDVTVFQPMKGSPIGDAGVSTIMPYKTIPGTYHGADAVVAMREEIDRDVRQALGMPRLAPQLYEHSMGQA
jgi:radical SAM superfamily enzyme YgiQ (UPF0313 family)